MRNSTLMVCCSLWAIAMSANAQDFQFSGTASAEDGSVLYSERHTVDGSCADGVFRPLQHQVDYQRPDASERFARKQLAYDSSVLRPSVHFTQPTFDEVMKITYPEQETLVINWDTPKGDSKTFEVDYTDDTVVDSGFDNLIRQNWARVKAGDSIEFRFLGPTRGEHYAFVLEPVNNDRVDAAYVVQLRPTGMVLRFLVDPIVLGYNEAGALTDYLGLTNIRKNQDENYTAHIRYGVDTYPDCELTP